MRDRGPYWLDQNGPDSARDSAGELNYALFGPARQRRHFRHTAPKGSECRAHSRLNDATSMRSSGSTRSVSFPVTTLVDCHSVHRVGEHRHESIDGSTGLSPSVQQHHRCRGPGTDRHVRQPHAGRQLNPTRALVHRPTLAPPGEIWTLEPRAITSRSQLAARCG